MPYKGNSPNQYCRKVFISCIMNMLNLTTKWVVFGQSFCCIYLLHKGNDSVSDNWSIKLREYIKSSCLRPIWLYIDNFVCLLFTLSAERVKLRYVSVRTQPCLNPLNLAVKAVAYHGSNWYYWCFALVFIINKITETIYVL